MMLDHGSCVSVGFFHSGSCAHRLLRASGSHRVGRGTVPGRVWTPVASVDAARIIKGRHKHPANGLSHGRTYSEQTISARSARSTTDSIAGPRSSPGFAELPTKRGIENNAIDGRRQALCHRILGGTCLPMMLARANQLWHFDPKVPKDYGPPCMLRRGKIAAWRSGELTSTQQASMGGFEHSIVIPAASVWEVGHTLERRRLLHHYGAPLEL